MKKQSLIALAPMAIFAFAMSAMAEEPAVVERTAEVSEILNAGAEKVQSTKKYQTHPLLSPDQRSLQTLLF